MCNQNKPGYFATAVSYTCKSVTTLATVRRRSVVTRKSDQRRNVTVAIGDDVIDGDDANVEGVAGEASRRRQREIHVLSEHDRLEREKGEAVSYKGKNKLNRL